MTAKTGKPVGRPPKAETLILRRIEQAVQEAMTAKTPTRVRNNYDAGGRGRRMAGWNPKKTSPNTAIAQAPLIRERSRDSSRNDWASASTVQKWATSLIGIGITPRWTKSIKVEARKKVVVQLWQDWGKVSDADGVLDIYGQQTMSVRTWFDGGECFARKRRRFSDNLRYPVPVQVQLLEADMCPMIDITSRPGLPVGNEIKSGIEFDKRGQRVAYWFFKNHPGDKFVAYNGEELVRVAASEVCHIFEPKRPGQIRGVSESAPILARLRSIADYEDATLERQKLANLFVAFLKRETPDYNPLASDVDPLDNKPLEMDPVTDTPVLSMEPGMFQTLEDGEEVQFSNPPEAGTTYSDYNRTMQLGTAAGQGMPYELMSGDIKDISDRTLRVVMNEFRRLAEQRQWQVVIPMFCQKVVEWFAEAAVIAGLIKESEYDSVVRCEHAPHGWPYIHPTQDIEGKVAEMAAGVTSQSAVIGQRGDDPDQVAQEIADDDARMQRLKIGPYSKAAEIAKPEPAAAPGKKEPVEEKKPVKKAQVKREVQNDVRIQQLIGALDAV